MGFGSRHDLTPAVAVACRGSRDRRMRCGVSSLELDGMTLSAEDRILNYTKETKYPRSLFVAEDGRIVGTWIMGNDYRVTCLSG